MGGIAASRSWNLIAVGIASFDIFETLFVRVVGEPAAVFLLLARRARQEGLVDLDPMVLAVGRVEAEARARRRHRDREVTLTEIHDELMDGLGLDATASGQLLALELAVEDDLLVVHPPGAALLAHEREHGRQIVFVSDTYLPESFLVHLLKSRGLYRSGDQVFASCASGGRTKVSGRLFRHVLDIVGVEPRDMLHVGNSERADIRPAERLGIRARLLESGNLTKDERRLEEWRFATGGLSSVMAGAARLARVSGTARPGPRAEVIQRVAADVAAPLLSAFVLWMLRESQRAGLRRLYFLAREAQILYEIACELREQLSIDVDLHYLHVSRQSINVAAIDELNEQELSWALTHAGTNTTRTILQRLGVEAEVCADELAEIGIDPDAWDRVPEPGTLRRLLDSVGGGALRPHALLGVQRTKDLAIRYLEQEGFLDDVSTGVVDTSGSGSQIRTLTRLRAARGCSASPGYLLVRRAPPHQADDLESLPLRGWYEDEVRERGYGQPPGRAALLEVFCAADHGTTLGYVEHEGRVRPRLATGCVTEQVAWGLPILRDTVAAFIRSLRLDPLLVDLDADLRGVLRELLRGLWEEPSAAVADVWGSFPFEGSSGQEIQTRHLASPVATVDVIRGMARGRIRSRSWFDWPAASQAVSRPVPRALLACARRAKRFTLRCRGILARSKFLRRSRHWFVQSPN